MVVLVTSCVSELHPAQHGTSAGEYKQRRDVDAKVEGDQWKEIMNQAQTNETIGQGLETNVSKVKQKLIEAPRGSSQRAAPAAPGDSRPPAERRPHRGHVRDGLQVDTTRP